MEITHKLSHQNGNFSVEDCNVLLKKKLKNKSFCIIDYNVRAVKENSGYFGDLFKISINVYHGNKMEEILCFGKSLLKHYSDLDLEMALGAFKKEIFIYNDIFKRFGNHGLNFLQTIIPECYHIKLDFMLVFEDLEAKGYASPPRYSYLDYSHVFQIIKALAKIHASSLIYEEKTSTSLEVDFSKYEETFYGDKVGHKGTRSLYAALNGLYTEMDLFGITSEVMSNEELKICMASACSNMLELVKPSKTHRNVVCHGDLWQTNFMMRYDKNIPVECMIIDFQTARYAPPAQDLMAFLYLTTSREFRERYQQSMIDLYYEELKQHTSKYNLDLNVLIPYDQFLASCEHQKLFGAVQSATYFQLTHAKCEYVVKLSKNTKKWERALYDDHSIIILENYQTDPVYRERLEESLKDLCIVCEKIYTEKKNYSSI